MLLVLGAVGSHLLFERPHRERYSGPAYTDTLPRSFFLALDPERRRALADRFTDDRKAFRDGRRDMREAAASRSPTPSGRSLTTRPKPRLRSPVMMHFPAP